MLQIIPPIIITATRHISIQTAYASGEPKASMADDHCIESSVLMAGNKFKLELGNFRLNYFNRLFVL